MDITETGLDLIKYFSSLGVGGGIAGLVLYFARKDYINSAVEKLEMNKQFVDRLEHHISNNRQERQIMIDTLEQVSKTISANSEIVRSVRDDILRR